MKLFLGLLCLIALSVGVYIYADIATQPASVITTTYPQAEALAADTPVYTITYTDDGYQPTELVIPKGAAVRWENESKLFHWPASDFHPSHLEYPEFDPRKAIAPGEEWTFVFENAGTWNFHNHIQARESGVIFVEDPEAEAFVPEGDQIIEETVVE